MICIKCLNYTQFRDKIKEQNFFFFYSLHFSNSNYQECVMFDEKDSIDVLFRTQFCKWFVIIYDFAYIINAPKVSIDSKLKKTLVKMCVVHYLLSNFRVNPFTCSLEILSCASCWENIYLDNEYKLCPY